MIPTLSPEDLRLILIADRSIWSDEVEMLAKIRSDILSSLLKKTIRWERLLPERFVDSALITSVPNETMMKSITRGLSGLLDGFASMVSKMKR